MKIEQHNLEAAIAKLKTGTPLNEVLSNIPIEQIDLRNTISSVNLLLTIPKNTVPVPAMQRKFIYSPIKHIWLSWLPVSRIAAASLSIVLLISSLAGTGYAALSSVPGQTLFSVKKSVEHLRIKFAQSPEARINLQVAIAKQRISEAQEIFQNPDSKPEQEKAALAEVMSETKKTIEVIDTATKQNPKQSESHPLVASLENITKQQQDLLKQIKPKNQLTDTTKVAIETTKENVDKVTQIKKYIQAAADEQSLTDLASNPKSVTISGNINSFGKNNITIEKTSFIVGDQTTIKNTDGSITNSLVLSTGTKVSIIGTKENNKLTANQITILDYSAPPIGIVKGVNIETASSTPKISAPSSTSVGLNKKESPQEQTKTPDPNAASATFIPEDPAHQSPF